MNISKILQGGECSTVEFKDFMNENAYKTLSAFSNTEGGTLLCGVSDTGNITGFDCSDEPVRTITNKIVNQMGISPSLKCVKIDGKKILVIKLEKSSNPISYKGRYYKRAGNITHELKGAELRDFFLRGTNWDAITGDYSFDEIDNETLFSFVNSAVEEGRLLNDGTKDPKIVLKRLNLVINDKLTNAAIILFGKNPQQYFTNATIRIVTFKGDVSTSDRIIDGNLFKQIKEAEKAIKNSLNVKYEIKGKLTRDEIWDYPIEAIREALLNCIIHRDYFKFGIETQIKISEKDIWFFNPGGLFGGMTIEKLKFPHPSLPRNPLIVNIFFRAGLVEKYGSGINRILTSLEAYKLPEPQFKEEFGGFSLYMGKDRFTEGTLKDFGLNEYQIKAVLYVKEHGSLRMAEYSKLIPEVKERTLRRYLSELVDEGILIAVGEKKGRKYLLSR